LGSGAIAVDLDDPAINRLIEDVAQRTMPPKSDALPALFRIKSDRYLWLYGNRRGEIRTTADLGTKRPNLRESEPWMGKAADCVMDITVTARSSQGLALITGTSMLYSSWEGLGHEVFTCVARLIDGAWHVDRCGVDGVAALADNRRRLCEERSSKKPSY
jgi:hypothetical protein